jgi:predicted nucleic acid-binding Zn ribbon protein
MTWRPLPSEPDPAAGPRPVRHSLDRVTRSLGGPEATVLAAVFGRWEDVVGPAVAAHSWPISVADGILTVAVDQPGWATQLTYLEADLRRRIAEVSGSDVVRRVRVTVRSGDRPGWYPGDSG